MHLIISTFVLFFSLSSSADTFYVEEISGTEISSQDKSSVRELIRLSVPQTGDHKTVNQALQADWILSSKLLKLGDAYILNIEKKSGKKSGPSFTEKMKSSSMDNMDVTAQRLTTAVINGQKVAATADVTNITDEEKKQNTNRYEATRQWILGLGPSWTSNLNSAGAGGFTLLIGFEWGLDPDYSVDISYIGHGGRGEDDSNFGDFSIGGTYYFSRSRNSPFMTARIGFGSADINDGCDFLCTTETDDPSGWTGSVAAGMKFFRTSSVNVSTYLRYSQIFDRTEYGNASMTSFMVAVHY
jgi:hypothetical protein